MNVLIAYGSVEGQTKKIARHIRATVEQAGHACKIHDCADADTVPDLGEFDAVILAGSIHQRKHEPKMTGFAQAHADRLAALPSALVSVSLIITTDDGREEAEGYVAGFAAETGWTPGHVHLAAGAVRYLEYDFFKEFTIKEIVYKGHKDMPAKDGSNPEFTDWAALAAFVEAFLEEAAPI